MRDKMPFLISFIFSALSVHTMCSRYLNEKKINVISSLHLCIKYYFQFILQDISVPTESLFQEPNPPNSHLAQYLLANHLRTTRAPQHRFTIHSHAVHVLIYN